jgi:hypothetical protein|nr:hypothetical protein [Neorhizobium tomejilense]
MAIEYTINLQKAGRELAVGQLVLIQIDTTRTTRGGFKYATAVGKVIEYKDGKAVIDVDGRGPINAMMPRADRSGLDLKYPARELEFLALNTLATENHEIVHEYLDRLATSRDSHAVAFHVTDVNSAGEVRGRLIGENSERDVAPSEDEFTLVGDARDEDRAAMGLASFGNAEVTAEVACTIDGFGDLIGAPPSGLVVRKGDILIARGFAVEIEDGIDSIRLVNVAVVGNAASTEDAVAYLGLDKERPDRYWGAPSLASFGEIQHIYEIGFARTQPDKALAVSFDAPSGERKMAVLGSSGYHAFVNDELQTYLEQDGLEPGLWTMHNLKNVTYTDHEGNWDADIEGDWLPATPADVEELFGPLDSLDGELASIMETDPEKGLGERMMKAAEVARFEENFAEEHRKFAMQRFGVIDEGHWSARQVANPAAIDAYAAAPFADIDDGRLRSQLSEVLRREIRTRSSLFLPIAPTEAERAELAKETNWGKHKPSLFMPNAALDADRDVFAAAVRANIVTLVNNVDSGRNFSHMGMSTLMRKLQSAPLSAEGLPVFSDARQTEGNWHFVGREKKWITLALFVGDVHVATLKTDMHHHSLTTAYGLNLTKPYHDGFGTKVHIPVPAVVLDADRAVCEIEARHWRDHDHSDFCAPTRDGIHTSSSSIAYISDGVLHREDGPALQHGMFFNDCLPLVEHRFRGNLHRNDGPAVYQGEHGVWYRHGLEHRTDGPSTDLGGGDFEYRLFDKLHREDGPAIVGPHGKSWYRDDRLHREDGPSIVNGNGEMWHRHGVHHREEGPAISLFDGSEGYYVNGVLHNDSGPAYVSADGEHIYAIDGAEMDEDEFLERTAFKTAPSVPLTP